MCIKGCNILHIIMSLFQYNKVRTSHTMQVSGNTVNNLSTERGQKGRKKRKEVRKGKDRGEEG